MKSLAVGIPAYSGWLSVPTFLALQRFLPIAQQAKIGYVGASCIADCDVAMARNELVHQFRSARIDGKPLSHFLMIDDDIAFDPRVIVEMMALDVPIVGGIVPLRRLDLERVRRAPEGISPEDVMGIGLDYNVSAGELGKRAKYTVEPDGSMLVDRIGTAFLLLERGVFDTIEERMSADERKKMTYYVPDRVSQGDTGERFKFFDRGVFEDAQGRGSYLGEDYFFCDLARAADVPVRAFARAPFGHFAPFMFKGAAWTQRA